MASETPASRETQEQSIKARKHELFQPEAPPATTAAPRKTIKEYLRDTRPVPMAPTVKAILWVAGVLVVLLLLASLFSASSRPRRRPQRPRSSATAVLSTQLAATRVIGTNFSI